MPGEAPLEARERLSTTLMLSAAAVATALVAMFGEEGSFSALTTLCALAGLVPWALAAGGVALHPVAFALLGVPPGVVVVAVDENAGGMFPLMLVVVWVTRTAPSRWLVTVVIAASGAAIAVLAWRKSSMHEAGMVYFLGGLGISWLAGLMLRRQEALTDQVRALRDLEVERLAADERARLAREVHDVVAHSLTIVLLNVTGARRALASRPEAADDALARAELVGRDSLDSIRQVMGLLREPGGGHALPQPDLAGLGQLVDGYRGAGLEVDLAVDDVAVEATVELVAYRVVQESLANVLEHAPGARATVAVGRAGDDHVEVVVANTAPPAPPARGDRAGLGARGMAERVRAVGGDLEAGPTADGGWRVAARLPARGAAASRVGEPRAATPGPGPR